MLAVLVCGLFLWGSGSWVQAGMQEGVESKEGVENAGIITAPTTIDLTLVTNLGNVTDITHAGDDRLFIARQAGTIRIVENGTLLPTPFLNIETAVDDGLNEQGLLGLTFHPDYANNKFFYVNYTHSLEGQWTTRISRFQTSPNANIADPNSETVVIEFAQTDWNHNGGAIQFGPDGYLYIAAGDGGGGGDPFNDAQDTGELLGKILRIDVDSVATGSPDCNSYITASYTIPADNPLADGAGGACDEIWAVGMRNPWRMSFDRETGDLWIADVGQQSWEEIDYEPAGDPGGHNYGWDCFEGEHVYGNSAPTCTTNPSDYTPPVYELSSQNGSGNCSITGGYVYRGLVHTNFVGHYLFADYCGGDPITLSGDFYNPTETSLAGSFNFPRTFGQDVNGELYVAESNGNVSRISDPSPIAVAVTASIDTANSTDVAISWLADGDNCSYRVYRATVPYEMPAENNIMATLPMGSTDYTDAGSAGTGGTSFFYVVRTTNCSGLNIADSTEVGAFNFALIPGSS